MAEVNEASSANGFSVPLRLHSLLLALAGRIDDTALTEARELIARAHIDEAVELTTGTLIAGRIPVRSNEKCELAMVLDVSRSDSVLANELIVDESEPVNAHRFSAENQPESGIAEALDRTLRVLPDVRSVHAVWRNTPAGSVSGSLPQRVVLIETGPDGNPPAVAFRVDTALRRAGIRAVVEVTGPGALPAEYHQAAGMAANPAWVAGTAPMSAFQSIQPEPASKPDEEPPVVVTTADAPGRHGSRPEPDAPIVPVVKKADAAETRTERTSEMSSDEVAKLRQALAEDPEKGREIVAGKPSMYEVVELPALDLEDPNLSERDRALLRELHAELAERERAEAAKIRLHNGASRGSEQRGWADGYSGG